MLQSEASSTSNHSKKIKDESIENVLDLIKKDNDKNFKQKKSKERLNKLEFDLDHVNSNKGNKKSGIKSFNNFFYS